MKFIRDIISEKSRLSAERAASMPPAGMSPTQTPDGQQTDGLAQDWDSIETKPSMPDAIQESPETSVVSEDDFAPDTPTSELAETPDTADMQSGTDAWSEDDLETASEDTSDPEPDSMDLEAAEEDETDLGKGLPVLNLDAFDLAESPSEDMEPETETTGSQMQHEADAEDDNPDLNGFDTDMPDMAAEAEINIFMPSTDEYEEDAEELQAAPQDVLQAESEAEPEEAPAEERAEDGMRRVRDAFAPVAEAEPAAQAEPVAQAEPADPAPIPETPAPAGAGGFANAQAERPPFPVPPSPSADPAIAAQQALAASVSVPAPAVGRGAARAGRVKTRLLGFNSGPNTASDPFDKGAQQKSGACTQFPVGWLVVVDGHGRGSAFTLFDGVSLIGRGTDQTVSLDFGDNSISRTSHAVIAYDAETRKFYLGHGGKTNLVRLNNRPVLSTEEMGTGDLVRIGETTLRFVGLCGSDFQWQEDSGKVRQNASFS